MKTVAVVGTIAIALLAAVYVVVGAYLVWILVLIAAFLAAAFNHPVDWLSRVMGRGVAIGIVMVLWLAAFAGAAVLLIPAMVNQLEQLVQNIPQYVQTFEHSSVYEFLERHFQLSRRLQQLGRGGTSQVAGVVPPLLSAVGGVVKAAAGLISIYFLVLFMLTSGGRLVRALLQEALPERRERYAKVLGRVYTAVGGYVLGLMIIVLINAVLTSTFLAILGVPYYLPLAVLSGLGSLVPFIGAILAGSLITGIALATGGFWHGVIALGYYLAYQMFENHVIAPIVYRQTINVNPLVILVALLVFGELWGVLGALVSVPVVATFQVVLQELLRLRRERIHLPPPSRDPPPPITHRPAEQH